MSTSFTFNAFVEIVCAFMFVNQFVSRWVWLHTLTFLADSCTWWWDADTFAMQKISL